MNKQIFNYLGRKLVYVGGFFAKLFFFKMSIPSLLSLLFSILTYYFSTHCVSGGENTGVQSDFRHPSRISIHSAYDSLLVDLIKVEYFSQVNDTFETGVLKQSASRTFGL